MILVDANLLIYAVNLDARQHETARSWLDKTLSGTVDVGLPWICVLAFLRVATHPHVFPSPLHPDQAIDLVESWLNQPFVNMVAPTDGHWPILRNLIRMTGTSGNLTSDAHVAALAIEHGATICSADHDFKRFPGVHHVNPLETATIHSACL